MAGSRMCRVSGPGVVARQFQKDLVLAPHGDDSRRLSMWWDDRPPSSRPPSQANLGISAGKAGAPKTATARPTSTGSS